MELIVENKPQLIKWLSADPTFIVQHVQSKGFVTSSEYDELMSISVPRKVVIRLLDIIYKKGEEVCRDFLNLLNVDDVNEEFPELTKWIKTVNTSGHKTEKDLDTEEPANGPIPENCQDFLKRKTPGLVQYVKNIKPIVDDLDLHSESVANVRAQTTDQDKMRKLLEYVNCESIAKRLVNALVKHERDLMNELLS